MPATKGTLLHISPLAMRAGCEMDCYRIIRALPDWRHEVLVLDKAAEMSRQWEELGARVSHLDCLRSALPSFIASIRAAVGDRQFSGVLLWSSTRFPYILHALRALDLPVGIHLGNPVLPRLRHTASYALAERLFSPLPRAVLLACSEHVRQSLDNEAILAAMPSTVIYNPVELPATAHVPRPLEVTAAVRIGMVARLDPIKDHRTLLQAWPLIRAKLPHATLELVGDGILRHELEALAQALQIESSVRFLGHRSDVETVARNWDVCVYSTTAKEGLGNALVEALALGLPAVVCDLPVMREVCGVDNVVHFPAGMPEQLAEAVVQVALDAPRRRQLGLRARAHAARVFDPARCAYLHLQALGLEARDPLPPTAPRPVLLHVSPLAMQAGCEMNCLRIIEALPEFNHHVLVLNHAGAMTEKWRQAGATVDHLEMLTANRTAFYHRLREYLWSQPRPAGVIYWSTTRLPLVLNALRVIAAPVVAHIGNPAQLLWWQVMRYISEEIVLPGTPGVRLAACSQYVGRSLKRNPYLRRFPADVIHNPVELPAEVHVPRPLSSDMPVRLGMVARIDPIKDHATALRALAIIRERFPLVTLDFAGDGELRPAIQQLAAKLGLAGCVRFLGQVDDVNARLPGWDAFLYSTTEAEGLGNALIEAQAAGLPCVVSDLPMMREVGGDDGGCVYFQAGDAADLARRTISLLGDFNRCLALAKGGRSRVARVFAPRTVAHQYLAALDLGPKL